MLEPANEDLFSWIRDGRSPLTPRGDAPWPGVSVAELLPPIFQSYVKFLHQIDLRYPTFGERLTAAEREVLRFPKCPELEQISARRRRVDADRRVTWKEVASLLGVPYGPSIVLPWFLNRVENGCWVNNFIGPAEGVLNPPEAEQLISGLRAFTPDRKVFFRLPELPFVHKPDQHLTYMGDLECCAVDKVYPWPEYQWPKGREWCVCSNFDMPFTVIGGSSELIETLLGNQAIECVEITATTRLDECAPMA